MFKSRSSIDYIICYGPDIVSGEKAAKIIDDVWEINDSW